MSLSHGFYRAVLGLVKTFYPKTAVQGADNLPDEPCIAVGNHAQMNGPIVGELYYPGRRVIWCASQMMERKEVPAYAFEDFWSQKPRWSRWFYRLLSHLIAPLSVAIFGNADTIPVYRDIRMLQTFRRTMEALEGGSSVIIFPECATPHNQIVYEFQDRFVESARMYYKRTGKVLSFVPMYVAPKLKTLYLGTPTAFRPQAPIEEERRRICDYLMAEITKMAEALPRHTVVPYKNLPKSSYPCNLPCEVTPDREETDG